MLMELIIKDALDVNLGDVMYYINTGSAKSHGDLKTIEKNKSPILILTTLDIVGR